MSELWQVVCRVESVSNYGTGLGVQSVLWSDAAVFTSNSEEQGNLYMYEVTQYAVSLLEGIDGETPIDIIDKIYPQVLFYAKNHTNVKEALRETFVRNALVAVDNALWQLYAREEGKTSLVDLVPAEYKSALSQRHKKLCNIPLISYGVSHEQIEKLLLNGAAILKIKIGFDDGGKMSKDDMLSWDKNRLLFIHSIAKKYRTDYTESGKILYYLDANGRYDSLKRVGSLLEYAKEIGALENIVLLEEPFDEDEKIDVSSLPVRVAADESVHSLSDVSERLDLGYKAIALKPIAKTLSETLKILSLADGKGAVCFCADLTVNPVLVEWNKNVAALIKTLPELKIGLVESNGEQNYAEWDRLLDYHPYKKELFAQNNSGIYNLDDKFYSVSGGIFSPLEYYDEF